MATLQATSAPNALSMSRWAASATAKWLYRVHRVLQKISGGRASLHVYLFCAQPVGAPALAGVRDDPSTRVVPVAPGDPLLSQFPRPQAVLAQRFAAGATCHAVLVKEQFAGHIWLATGHYDEDEVRCRYMLPDATTVWDFDVYIAPPFRATRAMVRLWKGVDAALHERGVQWSYSRISLYNAGSLQTHERLGARHLCTGLFLTLGPMQLNWLSHPTRLGFSMAGNRAPVVTLALPGGAPSSTPTTARTV